MHEREPLVVARHAPAADTRRRRRSDRAGPSAAPETRACRWRRRDRRGVSSCGRSAIVRFAPRSGAAIDDQQARRAAWPRRLGNPIVGQIVVEIRRARMVREPRPEPSPCHGQTSQATQIPRMTNPPTSRPNSAMKLQNEHVVAAGQALPAAGMSLEQREVCLVGAPEDVGDRTGHRDGADGGIDERVARSSSEMIASGTRCRSASVRMSAANIGLTSSPRPGSSDRIGSSPNRICVPGMRNRESRRSAHHRSRRHHPTAS